MVIAKFTTIDKFIKNFEISGHANSNDYGKDLICAGITSIVNGILNALDQLDSKNVSLTVSENLIKIDIKNINENNKLIMEVLKIQLKTIEIQFPKNFKIKEES